MNKTKIPDQSRYFGTLSYPFYYSLKAFTIIELMVVMLLSLIVFGVAATTYRLLYKQFTHYEKVSTIGLEMQLLHTLLQQDCNNSQSMKVRNKAIFFQKTPFDVIYNFENEYIMRFIDNAFQKTDTFFIQYQLPFFYFENKPQIEGLIDKMEIQWQLYDKPYKVTYHKVYSAEDLITKNKSQ